MLGFIGLIEFSQQNEAYMLLYLDISASQLSDPDVHLTQCQYSPLLGGFAVVLSNGRAAFITASTLKFEPMVSISFQHDIVSVVWYHTCVYIYREINSILGSIIK